MSRTNAKHSRRVGARQSRECGGVRLWWAIANAESLGAESPIETPVTGREVATLWEGQTIYRPLHGVRGTSYQPLYHQLDLRLDKSWTLDRTTVGAYLDVQNVYNHLYPEIWIYSADWTARASAIGLPIYPSLGVCVSY